MGKGKDVLWGEDVSSRMEEEKGLGRMEEEKGLEKTFPKEKMCL